MINSALALMGAQSVSATKRVAIGGDATQSARTGKRITPNAVVKEPAATPPRAPARQEQSATAIIAGGCGGGATQTAQTLQTIHTVEARERVAKTVHAPKGLFVPAMKRGGVGMALIQAVPTYDKATQTVGRRGRVPAQQSRVVASIVTIPAVKPRGVIAEIRM